MALFFHFFKTLNSKDNQVCGLVLIALRSVSELFDSYFASVKHFKDHFFFVTPFDKEAQVKICKKRT